MKLTLGAITNPKGLGSFDVTVDISTTDGCKFTSGKGAFSISMIPNLISAKISVSSGFRNTMQVYTVDIIPTTAVLAQGDRITLDLPPGVLVGSNPVCGKVSPSIDSISCSRVSDSTLSAIPVINQAQYASNKNIVFSVSFLQNPDVEGEVPNFLIRLADVNNAVYEKYPSLSLVFTSYIKPSDSGMEFTNFKVGNLSDVKFRLIVPANLAQGSRIEISLSKAFDLGKGASLVSGSEYFKIVGVDDTTKKVIIELTKPSAQNTDLGFSLRMANPSARSLEPQEVKIQAFNPSSRLLFDMNSIQSKVSFFCDAFCTDCGSIFSTCTGCEEGYRLNDNSSCIKKSVHKQYFPSYVFISIGCAMTLLMILVGLLFRCRNYWGNFLYSLLKINFFAFLIVWGFTWIKNEEPYNVRLASGALLVLHFAITWTFFCIIKSASNKYGYQKKYTENTKEAGKEATTSPGEHRSEQDIESDFKTMFNSFMVVSLLISTSIVRWFFSEKFTKKGYFWYLEPKGFVKVRESLECYQIMYLLIITTPFVSLNVYMIYPLQSSEWNKYMIEAICLCLLDFIVYIVAFCELNNSKKKIVEASKYHEADLFQEGLSSKEKRKKEEDPEKKIRADGENDDSMFQSRSGLLDDHTLRDEAFPRSSRLKDDEGWESGRAKGKKRFAEAEPENLDFKHSRMDVYIMKPYVVERKGRLDRSEASVLRVRLDESQFKGIEIKPQKKVLEQSRLDTKVLNPLTVFPIQTKQTRPQRIEDIQENVPKNSSRLNSNRNRNPQYILNEDDSEVFLPLNPLLKEKPKDSEKNSAVNNQKREGVLQNEKEAPELNNNQGEIMRKGGDVIGPKPTPILMLKGAEKLREDKMDEDEEDHNNYMAEDQVVNHRNIDLVIPSRSDSIKERGVENPGEEDLSDEPVREKNSAPVLQLREDPTWKKVNKVTPVVGKPISVRPTQPNRLAGDQGHTDQPGDRNNISRLDQAGPLVNSIATEDRIQKLPPTLKPILKKKDERVGSSDLRDEDKDSNIRGDRKEEPDFDSGLKSIERKKDDDGEIKIDQNPKRELKNQKEGPQARKTDSIMTENPRLNLGTNQNPQPIPQPIKKQTQMSPETHKPSSSLANDYENKPIPAHPLFEEDDEEIAPMNPHPTISHDENGNRILTYQSLNSFSDPALSSVTQPSQSRFKHNQLYSKYIYGNSKKYLEIIYEEDEEGHLRMFETLSEEDEVNFPDVDSYDGSNRDLQSPEKQNGFRDGTASGQKREMKEKLDQKSINSQPVPVQRKIPHLNQIRDEKGEVIEMNSQDPLLFNQGMIRDVDGQVYKIEEQDTVFLKKGIYLKPNGKVSNVNGQKPTDVEKGHLKDRAGKNLDIKKQPEDVFEKNLFQIEDGKGPLLLPKPQDPKKLEIGLITAPNGRDYRIKDQYFDDIRSKGEFRDRDLQPHQFDLPFRDRPVLSIKDKEETSYFGPSDPSQQRQLNDNRIEKSNKAANNQTKGIPSIDHEIGRKEDIREEPSKYRNETDHKEGNRRTGDRTREILNDNNHNNNNHPKLNNQTIKNVHPALQKDQDHSQNRKIEPSKENPSQLYERTGSSPTKPQLALEYPQNKKLVGVHPPKSNLPLHQNNRMTSPIVLQHNKHPLSITYEPTESSKFDERIIEDGTSLPYHHKSEDFPPQNGGFGEKRPIQGPINKIEKNVDISGRKMEEIERNRFEGPRKDERHIGDEGKNQQKDSINSKENQSLKSKRNKIGAENQDLQQETRVSEPSKHAVKEAPFEHKIESITAYKKIDSFKENKPVLSLVPYIENSSEEKDHLDFTKGSDFKNNNVKDNRRFNKMRHNSTDFMDDGDSHVYGDDDDENHMEENILDRAGDDRTGKRINNHENRENKQGVKDTNLVRNGIREKERIGEVGQEGINHLEKRNDEEGNDLENINQGKGVSEKLDMKGKEKKIGNRNRDNEFDHYQSKPQELISDSTGPNNDGKVEYSNVGEKKGYSEEKEREAKINSDQNQNESRKHGKAGEKEVNKNDQTFNDLTNNSEPFRGESKQPILKNVNEPRKPDQPNQRELGKPDQQNEGNTRKPVEPNQRQLRRPDEPKEVDNRRFNEPNQRELRNFDKTNQRQLERPDEQNQRELGRNNEPKEADNRRFFEPNQTELGRLDDSNPRESRRPDEKNQRQLERSDDSNQTELERNNESNPRESRRPDQQNQRELRRNSDANDKEYGKNSEPNNKELGRPDDSNQRQLRRPDKPKEIENKNFDRTDQRESERPDDSNQRELGRFVEPNQRQLRRPDEPKEVDNRRFNEPNQREIRNFDEPNQRELERPDESNQRQLRRDSDANQTEFGRNNEPKQRELRRPDEENQRELRRPDGPKEVDNRRFNDPNQRELRRPEEQNQRELRRDSDGNDRELGRNNEPKERELGRDSYAKHRELRRPDEPKEEDNRRFVEPNPRGSGRPDEQNQRELSNKNDNKVQGLRLPTQKDQIYPKNSFDQKLDGSTRPFINQESRRSGDSDERGPKRPNDQNYQKSIRPSEPNERERRTPDEKNEILNHPTFNNLDDTKPTKTGHQPPRAGTFMSSENKLQSLNQTANFPNQPSFQQSFDPNRDTFNENNDKNTLLKRQSSIPYEPRKSNILKEPISSAQSVKTGRNKQQPQPNNNTTANPFIPGQKGGNKINIPRKFEDNPRSQFPQKSSSKEPQVRPSNEQMRPPSSRDSLPFSESSRVQSGTNEKQNPNKFRQFPKEIPLDDPDSVMFLNLVMEESFDLELNIEEVEDDEASENMSEAEIHIDGIISVIPGERYNPPSRLARIGNNHMKSSSEYK